jgi:hypothetical protein
MGTIVWWGLVGFQVRWAQAHLSAARKLSDRQFTKHEVSFAEHQPIAALRGNPILCDCALPLREQGIRPAISTKEKADVI